MLTAITGSELGCAPRRPSSQLACGRVRGNPSRMYPPAVSGCWSRTATISLTRESGTNSPRCMISLAMMPSGVPWSLLARSKSPVEMCGMPHSLMSSSAWVPFPSQVLPKEELGRERSFDPMPGHFRIRHK